jgi:hypothetical protein
MDNWEHCGNQEIKNSFIQAAVSAIDKPLREEAERCIDFFKKNLSFGCNWQSRL